MRLGFFRLPEVGVAARKRVHKATCELALDYSRNDPDWGSQRGQPRRRRESSGRNVTSEGPEAYAFSELGDGFTLQAAAGATLGQVTVIMSSWACKTGNWTASNCVTTPGATFSQSITVNIYSVSDGVGTWTPATLLATTTPTFNIPYRPSSTPAQCGGDASVWFDKKDSACYHGLAVPISVNFSGSHLAIPVNNQLIVTVVYNTTDYGPHPIGQTACNLTSAGCPYDSLNISTDSNNGNYQRIGSVLDPNGIFVNYTLQGQSCSGAAAPGLALDAPCWAGFHPEIQVQVNTNAIRHTKGNAP
jgi:hypothetical protein